MGNTVPQSVADVRANRNETILHVAAAIGKSKLKRNLFAAVYYGKQTRKPVAQLAAKLVLTEKQVLTLGKHLVKHEAFGQAKVGGRVAYEKDPPVDALKSQILKVVDKPATAAKIPTKSNPKVTITVKIPTQLVKVRPITVDDIDSFARVRAVPPSGTYREMPERQFKAGIQKVVAEPFSPKDWGGEKGDLFTTRTRIRGKRFPTAFAFKGPGLRGALTPARMGKNGDQIQSMFDNDAQVFLVQHWAEIKPSVLTALRAYATMKSGVTGDLIHYGVIDGEDSDRLIRAYPRQFAGTRGG